MNIGSTLFRLFTDRPFPEAQRVEPRLTPLPARVIDDTPTPKLALPPPSAPEAPRFDLRSVSPREFADITHELYMEGTLSWDEFQMVGFPSELDPRYNATIGALTGEKAQPDQPKDMLGHWEQRLVFERKYNPDADQVRTAENAVAKLSWQAQAPVKMSA